LSPSTSGALPGNVTSSRAAKATEIAGGANDVVGDKFQRMARSGGRELWQTAEKASHVVLFVFVIISFISSAQSRSALRASIA
jgi:hypothetical protein